MSFYGMYNSGDPTHQYYTLSLVNPPKSESTDQFPIEYRETRNSPYLKDPGSYYASVVRFTCTTPLLPIFIPSISNPDTGETEYSVTIHHPGINNGVPVRQHVFFDSVNPFVSKSLGVSASEYYYVYQPLEFINSVNAALGKAWETAMLTTVATALQAGNSPVITWIDDAKVGQLWVYRPYCRTPLPNAPFPSTYPSSSLDAAVTASVSGSSKLQVTLGVGVAAKYLRGDFVTLTGFNGGYDTTYPVKVLEIVLDTLTLDLTAVVAPTIVGFVRATTPVSIYMNASLYNLFSSFTAMNMSSVLNVSPAFGTHWKLIIAPTYNTVSVPATPGIIGLPQFTTTNRSLGDTDYTYICQQYSTVPLWSPVASFVFITSILPINPESISGPVQPGSVLTNAGNNSAIGTVLTDFEIPLESGYENKPVITYSPAAEYRLVDLNGNSSLNNIQISIGWRNKLGVFQPLNIGPNGFAQIKLLFRKRDFNGT